MLSAIESRLHWRCRNGARIVATNQVFIDAGDGVSKVRSEMSGHKMLMSTRRRVAGSRRACRCNMPRESPRRGLVWRERQQRQVATKWLYNSFISQSLTGSLHISHQLLEHLLPGQPCRYHRKDFDGDHAWRPQETPLGPQKAGVQCNWHARYLKRLVQMTHPGLVRGRRAGCRPRALGENDDLIASRTGFPCRADHAVQGRFPRSTLHRNATQAFHRSAE